MFYQNWRKMLTRHWWYRLTVVETVTIYLIKLLVWSLYLVCDFNNIYYYLRFIGYNLLCYLILFVPIQLLTQILKGKIFQDEVYMNISYYLFYFVRIIYILAIILLFLYRCFKWDWTKKIMENGYVFYRFAPLFWVMPLLLIALSFWQMIIFLSLWKMQELYLALLYIICFYLYWALLVILSLNLYYL